LFGFDKNSFTFALRKMALELRKLSFNMSKRNILLVLFAYLILVISSCKTHERCPAYGKANTTKSNRSVPA
jgi:hypothetical protein